ncbi:SulP family inorganic anion transporter [Poriferisphaera sp. WC338]|uniref:SulP family inorganic anion transporter n=1 Tax=Poriferisphaera sp. WC338 TaxID=3425129 RepID=UPI003D818FDF
MFNLFSKRPYSIKDEVLSGLTVALALVPEAVAFAFVAGVSPIIGLYSAFIIGLLTAILGGRPGMISGATGAMAVVVVALVAMHGVEYLFAAVILAGLIQITIGLCRLGKFIRIVPHPVMLGFVNGLAIVIFMAQFESFKTLTPLGTKVFLTGPNLFIMLGLALLTMVIIFGLPKLTRAVPASLAAILVVATLGASLNYFQPFGESIRAATVSDVLNDSVKANAVAAAKKDAQEDAVQVALADGAAAAANLGKISQDEISRILSETETVTIAGGLPTFHLPQIFPDNVFTGKGLWAAILIVLPYSLILAGVGLIESLMTLSLIDEITETRGRGNRECIGQGIANVTCGFFGGMGGCAMIGQSLINVNSGGKARLSGIVAALGLLCFVLFLAPLIEMIPIAALVGVMFMVVIGTFEWTSLRTFGKIPAEDVFVMVLVAGYTAIMHDLATAVILGVIVSAIVFAWKHAKNVFADVKVDELGQKVYQIHGPLFFGAVHSFRDLFDPKNDPDEVVVDFYYSRVYDHSGLEAIHKLSERYRAEGKRLHLRHLSVECQELLRKAGDLVEIDISNDPHYHVATDRLA